MVVVESNLISRVASRVWLKRRRTQNMQSSDYSRTTNVVQGRVLGVVNSWVSVM